jgi:hypothetical protein
MRISHTNLGVHVPGLREFVHASWTIPENPFLGPGMAGLRAFVPASFSLPPQPAGIGRFGDFVRAKFTLPPQPALGDFVNAGAMYPIPVNSVTAAAGSAASAPTMGMAWTSFVQFLEDPLIGTVPVWMIGGGAILVWALFFSGGEHSRYQRAKKASGAARRAYA